MEAPNLSHETFLTLQQAAKRLPGRRHISSVFRYAHKGVRGIRLETIVVGGRRYTSVEALDRFIIATTAAADGKPAPARTAKHRQRAVEAAERELDRAGITDRPKRPK